MEEKMIDKEFLDNIFIILKQDVEYDNKRAWDNIKVNLVEKIQLIYINSFFFLFLVTRWKNKRK